jgi:hypothetical protein
MYILFAILLCTNILTGIISLIAWRNSVYYGKHGKEVGEMLMSVKCEVEGDEAEHARILRMTPEEYKTEKQKGRILFRAGQEVVGISEGLQAPFRWR